MQPKCIAIIGAGGKTTALRTLAHAFAAQRVLVTTSTHIFPLTPPDCRISLIDPTPDTLLAQLRLSGAVCAGQQANDGKLCALPPELLAQAAHTADIVLCEADGAHHLPLKLHRTDEPVLPPQTDLCLIVAGLSALGRPVHEAVSAMGSEPQSDCRHRRTAVLRARNSHCLRPANGQVARVAESGRYACACRAG